jgi:hypothetical protein
VKGTKTQFSIRKPKGQKISEKIEYRISKGQEQAAIIGKIEVILDGKLIFPS